MSYVDENTGELLDEDFAMSLERWTERRAEEGMALANGGEPSEILKEITDLIKQTAVAIALRKTAKQDGTWAQQHASLALGITHKALRATIKSAGLQEPEPNQIQLFADNVRAISR